jgi:hypothetical protein
MALDLGLSARDLYQEIADRSEKLERTLDDLDQDSTITASIEARRDLKEALLHLEAALTFLTSAANQI